MKVACITDIHFGVKRGNDVFLNSQIKFFKEQFVPYLKENNISTIIIPGDFFDNRISTDSKVLDAVFDLFNNHLKDFQIHILVGNHDSYLESSIRINSLKILDFYKNVTIYENNTSITLHNKKIYMCPWITNNDTFLSELNELEPHDLCFGHFNFSNFITNDSAESHNGLSPELFYSKFKLTISGHFHKRSKKTENSSEILYMGNPFHFTRSDIGDSRGFCILDLEDLSYEFEENAKSIKFVSYKYPEPLTKEQIENNHVDIFIEYGTTYDEKAVDSYIARLETFNPAFSINKKTINTIKIDDAPDDLTGNTVPELIDDYMKNQDKIENKENIKSLMLDLYNECKNLL